MRACSRPNWRKVKLLAKRLPARFTVLPARWAEHCSGRTAKKKKLYPHNMRRCTASVTGTDRVRHSIDTEAISLLDAAGRRDNNGHSSPGTRLTPSSRSVRRCWRIFMIRRSATKHSRCGPVALRPRCSQVILGLSCISGRWPDLRHQNSSRIQDVPGRIEANAGLRLSITQSWFHLAGTISFRD